MSAAITHTLYAVAVTWAITITITAALSLWVRIRRRP